MQPRGAQLRSGKILQKKVRDLQFKPRCYACQQSLRFKIDNEWEGKNDTLSFQNFKEVLLFSQQENQYHIFCRKCFEKGHYFTRFVALNRTYFDQVKAQCEENIQKQYKVQQKWINDWNHFLDYRQKQLQQKQTKIINQSLDIQSKLKQSTRCLQSLNAKFKQFQNYQHKINEFVIASQKYDDLKDISNVSNIEEESFDILGDTLNQLNGHVADALGDFTELEVELSCKEDDFLVHEDQLEYRDRTYAIDNSLMQSMKISLRSIQNAIKQQLQSVGNELKRQVYITQQWKEPEPVNQAIQDFSILLSCSTCNRDLFINKLHYKKIGPSHFQMGVNFYIFNSPYQDSKNRQFNAVDTFQVFCFDCMEKNCFQRTFCQVYQKEISEERRQALKMKCDQGVQVEPRVVNMKHIRDYSIQIDPDQEMFLVKFNTYILATIKELQIEKEKKLKQQQEKKLRQQQEKKKQQKQQEVKRERELEMKQKREQEERRIERRQEKEKQINKNNRGESEQIQEGRFMRLMREARLANKLSQMWFLEEEEAQSYRLQALQNEQLMDLILQEGNELFGYPNDDLFDGLSSMMSDEQLWQSFSKGRQGNQKGKEYPEYEKEEWEEEWEEEEEEQEEEEEEKQEEEEGKEDEEEEVEVLQEVKKKTKEKEEEDKKNSNQEKNNGQFRKKPFFTIKKW